MAIFDDYGWNHYGRMSLVYVDFETQETIVKKRDGWFKYVVNNNDPGR